MHDDNQLDPLVDAPIRLDKNSVGLEWTDTVIAVLANYRPRSGNRSLGHTCGYFDRVANLPIVLQWDLLPSFVRMLGKT
jgi:hypothetical protein